MARMVERGNEQRVVVEYLEGKKQLGRARRRWKDKIEADFIAIVWDGRAVFIWFRIWTCNLFLLTR